MKLRTLLQISDSDAQGTLKGLLPEQLVAMDCRILLSNTYHLGNRHLNIQFRHSFDCQETIKHIFFPGLVLRYLKQLEDFTSDQMKHQISSTLSHIQSKPNPSTFVFRSLTCRFMGWPRSLLTDSGGFQMVSLLEVFHGSQLNL